MASFTKIFTLERHGKPQEERWAKCDGMHCPNCGEEGVWHPELDPGDYYVGETHICVECKSQFTIQGPQEVDDWNEPIFTALRGS